MKFMNLSPDADFYSKLQSKVDILMKNVLYITHQVDLINKTIRSLQTDIGIQKQVDDFYSETSPQEEK